MNSLNFSYIYFLLSVQQGHTVYESFYFCLLFLFLVFLNQQLCIILMYNLYIWKVILRSMGRTYFKETQILCVIKIMYFKCVHSHVCLLMACWIDILPMCCGHKPAWDWLFNQVASQFLFLPPFLLFRKKFRFKNFQNEKDCMMISLLVNMIHSILIENTRSIVI